MAVDRVAIRTDAPWDSVTPCITRFATSRYGPQGDPKQETYRGRQFWRLSPASHQIPDLPAKSTSIRLSRDSLHEPTISVEAVGYWAPEPVQARRVAEKECKDIFDALLTERGPALHVDPKTLECRYCERLR